MNNFNTYYVKKGGAYEHRPFLLCALRRTIIEGITSYKIESASSELPIYQRKFEITNNDFRKVIL